MKKIINVPNVITITRIISCIMAMISLLSGNIVSSICFYAYGAISDAFDGFFARKLNQVTDIGKKLDAVSDKVYALSLLAPGIVLGNYALIVTLILESIISGINTYSYSKYKNTYTEKIGKKKTIMLFPTMILGLIATKVEEVYLLFVPAFIASSKLQVDSILAYEDQLDKFKQENNKNTNIEINYSNDNSYNNYNNINNKCKKLVRKRDYNDRY